MSRPTLCLESYIETMGHVKYHHHHHHHQRWERWDAYHTALQRARENKAAEARLLKDMVNEADEVIGTLRVTINDILAVKNNEAQVDNNEQCGRQNIGEFVIESRRIVG